MVSIVIPVYNAELYIKECLDSILRQTYTDYEILIIEDKSSDNTKLILKEYENNLAEGNKFHFFYLGENGGVSNARNIGITHASGEYIWFVDADDLVSEDALDYLIDVQKRSNADIVRCAGEGFGGITTPNLTAAEHTRIKASKYDEYGWFVVDEYDVKYGCLDTNYALPKPFIQGRLLTGVAGSLFCKNAIYNCLFLVDYGNGEDKQFLQDVVYENISRAGKIDIAVVHDYLYFSRQDSISNSRVRIPEDIKRANASKVTCNWLKLVRLIEPDDKKMAKRKLQALELICETAFHFKEKDNSLLKNVLYDLKVGYSEYVKRYNDIASRIDSIKYAMIYSVLGRVL